MKVIEATLEDRQKFAADILPTIKDFDGWTLTTTRHWQPKLEEAGFECEWDGKDHHRKWLYELANGMELH